jgi:hypothetical protein
MTATKGLSQGMKFPATPDLGRPRSRLLWTALFVMALVGVITGVRDAHTLARTLGDTDDATRIVLVRGLLNGQGWWDQHLTRLQPPVGVYMHWSRLLDGGIAAMERLFALVVDWPTAEWLTRFTWPLLWVFPAAVGVLTVADRLSERSSGLKTPGAVLICALLLVTNFILYIQFHPGRVDHHDVQMTLCFLALAGAVQRGPGIKGAVLAGVATGLGLAVGLEALVFEAAIGGAIALRFVFDPQDSKPLRAYGLALAGTTLLAFCIQTPPWRWGVSACDALAANSTAAIVVAGFGIAAVARLAKARTATIRFIALAICGAATALVYLALDPGCIRGPFADVDPAIKVFWLSHVQEMKPWLGVLKQKPLDAVTLATPPIMAVLGLLWLGRRRETRQDSAFRLTTVILLMTMAAGFSGGRMCGYADWIAMPVLAAAAADAADAFTRRYHRQSLIIVLITGLAIVPETATSAIMWVGNTVGSVTKSKTSRKVAPEPADHCFDTPSYRTLAAAGPPGLVLSEIDLGPFILAHTQDSALAAPYHRMSWGMLAARGVLSADADNGDAEAKARALGIKYVLECDAHRAHTDRLGMSAESLQKRLDEDEDEPDWLERVNPPDSVLEVFRVRPPAAKP